MSPDAAIATSVLNIDGIRQHLATHTIGRRIIFNVTREALRIGLGETHRLPPRCGRRLVTRWTGTPSRPSF
jgi:hypothetical protein